jgi:hypothetical protein
MINMDHIFNSQKTAQLIKKTERLPIIWSD